MIFGFGTLGRALLQAIEATGHFRLDTVVDTAPGLSGRRVGEILPSVAFGGLTVSRAIPAAPSAAPAALCFHASTSHPATATAEILELLDAGYHVVSAAEWLFHPWLRQAVQARALDARARAAGRSVLGCGINPGFCFEALPILLGRTMAEIASIEILRVSDVRGIGPADCAHVGLGLSQDAFGTGVAAGTVEGHMGFPESVAALAECAGLAIDAISDRLEPTLATEPIVLAHRIVERGEVAGITQTAVGNRAGRDVITMRLEMFLDPAAYGRAPQERVEIRGSRDVTLSIAPAAPAVAGAAAMMVHTAPALASTEPGLHAMLSLPLGGARPQRVLRAAEGLTTRDRGGVSMRLVRT